MFYISKLDEEHANFFNVFDSLREMFGASVIPFTFPILKGEQAVGLVDLIEKKAYDANGKEIPCPPRLKRRSKSTWQSSMSRLPRPTKRSWRSSSWKSPSPKKSS